MAQRGHCALARPRVGEPGEQGRKLLAVIARKLSERRLDAGSARALRLRGEGPAGVGQMQGAAPGVVGVGVASHMTGSDGRLYEPARPGLVDADSFGQLTDRQGCGCCSQRLEQPESRRHRKTHAGAVPTGAVLAGPPRAVMVVDVRAVLVIVIAVVVITFVVVIAAVLVVGASRLVEAAASVWRAKPLGAWTAPPAQPRERGGDCVDRVDCAWG